MTGYVQNREKKCKFATEWILYVYLVVGAVVSFVMAVCPRAPLYLVDEC
jgi:hypothetical protein